MVDLWTILEVSSISVLAYIVGAAVHIVIDNVHGRRLVDRYFRTTKEQIIEPLRVEILGKVGELQGKVEELEVPDIAPQFESFLRSDPGKQWARELAGVVAADFEEVMVQRTASAAGAAARTAQSELVKLIDGSIDFENQVLNGLWGMVPREAKMKLYNKLARVLRKTGIQQIQEAEFENVSEGTDDASGDALALPPEWQR